MRKTGSGTARNPTAYGARGRFSLRITRRSPDHVSSIAQTLLSTRPFASATSRTMFSVISVSTPELFLGQATHSAPAGSSAAESRSNRHRSSAAETVKNTITSSGPRALDLTSTLSGSSPSVSSKRSGAPTSARRDSGLMPSFFGRGVPEYPATCRTLSGSESAATGSARRCRRCPRSGT